MIKLLWPQSYLAILLGAASALLGWNFSQLLLLMGFPLNLYPLLLFTSTSLTLCLGLTAGEIFLNNPARPRLAWFRFRPALRPTSQTALLCGFGAGLITLLILLPFVFLPATLLRITSWALVGGAIGFAEGQAWKIQTTEAGDLEHTKARLKNSRDAGIAAGVAAGVLFELLRFCFRVLLADSGGLEEFQAIEEPLGFLLFGGTLGYFLSCTSSPTYRAALRAGAGFEFTRSDLDSLDDSDSDNLDDQSDNLDDLGNLDNPNFTDPPCPYICPQEYNSPQGQTTLATQPILYTLLPFLKPLPSNGTLKFVNRSGQYDTNYIGLDGNQELNRIQEGLSIQLPDTGRIFIGNPRNQYSNTHIILPGILKTSRGQSEPWPYCAHLDITSTIVTLTVQKEYREHLRLNGRSLSGKAKPIPLRHNDILTFSNPSNSRTKYGPQYYRFIYYNRFLDPQA